MHRSGLRDWLHSKPRRETRVENPFQRVFDQKKIEILLFGSRFIQEALLHGCGSVGGDRFAQTRDSIYGRMTLTTRHTLAARQISSMVAFFSR
jgi:hypothetical protein